MTGKSFFVLFVFLSILNIVVRATVITQNKKVLATADDSDTYLLYVKEQDGLLQVANSRYEVTGEFESGKDALDVDYHYSKDLLVWSTRQGKIYSCGLRDARGQAYVRSSRLLHEDPRWRPISLAIDYLGDRLYVLDAWANFLRVLDLPDPGNRAVAIDIPLRNYKPVIVEIDPQAGFLFLLDHGMFSLEPVNHILRMHLDGSEPKVIDPPTLSKESIIGKMTLDRPSKQILVSSVLQRRIFSMDYEGQILRTIKPQQNAAISISATSNELFWVNAFNYHENDVQSDGSVYRCVYSPSSGCQVNSTQQLTFGAEEGVVLTVRAVDPGSQKLYGSPPAPAKLKVCEVGWRMDGSECRRVREFLLYEGDGVVRSACLTGTTRDCWPILPFPVPEWVAKVQKVNEPVFGFDYDSSRRKLYYGSTDALYVADLTSGSKKRLLYQKGVSFGPLAVDWTNGNLYYTEIERRGNVSFHVFKVSSVLNDDPERAQVSSTQLWEFGGVHSIAVHPERGYVFVSVFDNTKRKYVLLRLHTNAHNSTLLAGLGEATFINLNYENDYLYVLDATGTTITRSNLCGQNIQKTELPPSSVVGPVGFLVHKGIAYVKTRTSLSRFNVSSGQALGELDLFPHDRAETIRAGLRLHRDEPPLRLEAQRNPCALDNGGCDNFCFAVPETGSVQGLKKVCQCFDGVKCSGLVSGGKHKAL